MKTTYGIIGNPLDHSLSPVMHNTAFKEFGVDAVYEKFPLEADEVESFLSAIRRKESPIFGLNVTVPYKETVLPFLDSVTALAEQIGAVNTIVVNEDRKLIGYNTDAPGFISHLAELNFDLAGKNIAILGAGGSARAIITTLCLIPDAAQSIRVYNRTSQRSEALLKDLSGRINISNVELVMDVEGLELQTADLLINTTSVGLKSDDPILVDETLLHPDLLVYDLIYNPKETLLLKMAREAGAKTSNGLGMLFYQGVLALQHWAGTQIDDPTKIAMRYALEQAAY